MKATQKTNKTITGTAQQTIWQHNGLQIHSLIDKFDDNKNRKQQKWINTLGPHRPI